MGRPARVDALVRSMRSVMGSVPLTLKMRTGVYEDKPVAHKLITRLKDLGLSLITVGFQLHDLDFSFHPCFVVFHKISSFLVDSRSIS